MGWGYFVAIWERGMMMVADKWMLVMTVAGALALAGCGKPVAPSQPDATEPAEPAVADAPSAPAAAEPADGVTGANATLTGAGEFVTKARSSPFAGANMALSEGYNQALVACQIGDYARAVIELDSLAASPDLTPEQQQAVKDLLARALKMAPEVAARREAAAAGPAEPQTPPQFPLVVSGTVESSGSVLDNPFSTADRVTWKNFARARAAFDIGDYATARDELNNIASNPQLNYQQKYAVQSLLDKMPQAVPAAPDESSGQTPKP